jgi:hypothetical protein
LVAVLVSTGAVIVAVVVTGCVTASVTGATGAVTVTSCGDSTVSWETTVEAEETVVWVEPELTGWVAGCEETMLWELAELDEGDRVLEVGEGLDGGVPGGALGVVAGLDEDWSAAGAAGVGAGVVAISRGASLRTLGAGLAVGGSTTGAGWVTAGSGGAAGAVLATTGAVATAWARPLAAGEAGAPEGWLFWGVVGDNE